MSMLPATYIPHGGGPCFFMDDPHGVWTDMEAFLRGLPGRLGMRPSAILLVSGHWETDGFALTGGERPDLIYDYYNFPAHTYQLTYPAAGSPPLAQRAAMLLGDAGLPARIDPERGFDHGVFIPMKVAFPDATIPIVQMSLDRKLDPGLHLAAGRALAPLRAQGVAIIGSGMSFHNMRGYGHPDFTRPAAEFDAWLTRAVTQPAAARDAALLEWDAAPGGRLSHPREEHLLPLMVAAGAADGPGERIFSGAVVNTAVSGFLFQ
ncbi:MAG TPA: class III extradiol ring-cleavage dioxygenase [Allosphingosinicella sp.]|nr:class III extradiol ring-cleavage dioxygenase [Allosphingosinicella sp.]